MAVIINNKKQSTSSVVPTITSILYSGIGIGAAVEHQALTVGIQATESDAEFTNHLDHELPDGATMGAITTKREIAFIDRNVDDLGTLLAGMRADVQPILLSDDEAAPRQMARAVQGREGLEAIHVIAHRRPGGVSFGAGALTLDTTGEYAREFAEIGRTLRDGAVQLWTCETSWSGASALARSMEHVRCHTPLA